MWSMVLGLFARVPKRLWLYLAAAVLGALIIWRVYDAGHDAAAAECEAAELRATAEQNAKAAADLEAELSRRDRIAERRARERRARERDMKATITELRGMLDDASEEVRECAGVDVPGAAFERLRQRAAEGGAGQGNSPVRSDRSDADADPE